MLITSTYLILTADKTAQASKMQQMYDSLPNR